jgi:flagellar basal body-associated protein FliL
MATKVPNKAANTAVNKPANTAANKANNKATNTVAQNAALKENLIVYIAVVAFSIALGIFVVWVYFYQKNQQAAAPTKAFSQMSTVRLQLQDFSLRANLTLQSPDMDTDWLKKNKGQVEVFLESTIRDTPPEELNTSRPEKIPQLQDKLTDALNKKFPNANIQQVLFTEFLTSRDAQ